MQWGNYNPVSTTCYRKASLFTEDLTGPILHMKVKVKELVAQLCSTLCNPMDHSPSDISVHGALQARILEWIAVSFNPILGLYPYDLI